MKNPRLAINSILSLLAFLSVGAMFGGLVFIISPDGVLFRMPLSILGRSPFGNFFIPGMILFFVLGLVPAYVFWGMLSRSRSGLLEKLNVYRDMHWAWTSTIYCAVLLIGWIQVEMYFLQSVHWSHCLYLLVAVALILLSLSEKVRLSYRRSVKI